MRKEKSELRLTCQVKSVIALLVCRSHRADERVSTFLMMRLTNVGSVLLAAAGGCFAAIAVFIAGKIY